MLNGVPIGWEERTASSAGRDGESASVFIGYTSTESDNFYWDSLKKMGKSRGPGSRQALSYAQQITYNARLECK